MGKNCECADEPVKHNAERLFGLQQHESLHHTQRQHRAITAVFIKVGLTLLLVCANYAPRSAYAQFICESCEVEVGAGGTYHFWARTGSLVLPVSVTWNENRYEFGIFRFTDQQLLPLPGTRRERHMANPYWGVSLSRRWQIFERGPVQGFFGFGLAGRTTSDELSATRLDFASQLGLRFRLPSDHVIGEVTMRHWSNGGIKLPNHGQDFATVTFRVNSRLFGLGKEGQYAIDPSFNLNRPPAANDPDWERTALP
jgi:hypothetical protein